MSEEMTGEGVGPPSAATDPTAVVSLQAILEAFSAPISEEQAWAVCHQCAQAAHSAWSQDRHACWLVTDLAHVRICADGTVHPATWDARQTSAKGTAPHTEKTPGPEEEVYRKIAANEQKARREPSRLDMAHAATKHRRSAVLREMTDVDCRMTAGMTSID
ncbi:hypothetical protein FJT64_000629 [Amphibalanus amphitrite]|uniref:KIND domain-containing protein n=1 Tax=Amphibalanus amphitrite TaxID=1232801 RepID=A0A6A4VNY7_AMPAM|nr:hypothetical protein FJT64_000629 [Amphibalanus amphitrite]